MKPKTVAPEPPQDPRDPDDDGWHHVFVRRLPLTPDALDPLLRLVADDGTGGVIITDDDLIPPTSAFREELMGRYHGWLPTTESGL